MINSRRFTILLCACLALSILGCASRPDEEIKLAEDARNQALEQQAEQYAPSEWQSAKEAWDEAQAELAEEKFASAATSFVTAKARMLKAAEVAEAERASMQKQVELLQGTIDANYAELTAGATPAKLRGDAGKEYESALADIDKRIAQVKSQMDQGDYIGAKANAQGALKAIDYIMEKLQIDRTMPR